MSRPKVRVGATALCATLALSVAAIGPQLSTIASEQAGVASVFTHPDVQAVLTMSGEPAAKLAGYALVVDLDNPAHKPLGAVTGVNDDYQVTLTKAGADLAAMREVGHVLYLRIYPGDIAAASKGSAGVSEIFGLLAHEATTPGLGFLHTLATGGWVGLSEQSVEAFARSHEPKSTPVNPFSPSVISSLEHHIEALLSARSLGEQNGEQVYQVKVSARALVGAVEPIFSKLPGFSPSRMGAVPPGLYFTVKMYESDGNLVDLQASASSSSAVLNIALSYPSALTISPPAPVSMINLPEVVKVISKSLGGMPTTYRGMPTVGGM